MQSPRYVAKYGAIRFLSCPGRAGIVSKFRAVSGTACKMPSPTPPKSAKVELRTSPTYLSRLSASVASLTRANHFGQHLSTFSSKGLPPRLRDPRLGDRDQLSAGQNLLSREGRQPSIDQPGNQACVETVGAQQRLRRAVCGPRLQA